MAQDTTWKLTVILSAVWFLSLLYGEMFAFWVPSLWTCSWPHLHRPSSSIYGVENPGDYVKVAVLTDPQLMDRTSLSLAPKSLALEIAQFYTDLFMRRAFLSSVLPFKPDAILFLGDYFDGGPFLSDEEWQESFSRFWHIFDLYMLQQTTNVKVYYLAGNHDIGYADMYSRMPEVIRRYEKRFGPRNHQFTLGKVDFVAVDAQSLDGHEQRDLISATWKFVKNISKNTSSTQRVLLTHIPLYRPDWTSCGPLRSSPVINQRIYRSASDQEIRYQNYITEEKTKDLLDLIKPALILSGHDHDQCKVAHVAEYGTVEEHTVGTISWQQGNLFPSFMLLSASNFTFPNGSMSRDAISTQLCFLPVQTYIYIWYIVLFIVTLIVALFWPTNGVFFSDYISNFLVNIRSLLSNSMSGCATKEKSEDENCEYEMIWDAEGSMHLVRKASKPPNTNSTEIACLERGNAVMRSVAKKQVTQDTNATSLDVGSDAMKLPPRTNRSKTKLVVQRLVRAFRVFTVIASLNLPLYMLLLFKDWIDK